MYYVYFSFSSKNSINIVASPSPFIIGNYSLTVLTLKYLSCVLLYFLHRQLEAGRTVSALRNGVISLGLATHTVLELAHIFCFSLTFMYLNEEQLLK